jgi:hypothetical protein
MRFHMIWVICVSFISLTATAESFQNAKEEDLLLAWYNNAVHSRVKFNPDECSMIQWKDKNVAISEMVAGVWGVRAGLGMISKFMGAVAGHGALSFVISPACASATETMTIFYSNHLDQLEKLAKISDSSLKIIAQDDPELVRMVLGVRNRAHQAN